MHFPQISADVFRRFPQIFLPAYIVLADTVGLSLGMNENELSYHIRGCIFKVFNTLGPGLLESA